MKVLLKQHYQDARVHLYPGQQCEVSDTLGAYLLQHRMAERIEEAPAPVVDNHLDVEPQFEQAETPPEPKPEASPLFEKPQRRSRRAQ